MGLKWGLGRSGVCTDNVVYPELLFERENMARIRVMGVSRGRRRGRGRGK